MLDRGDDPEPFDQPLLGGPAGQVAVAEQLPEQPLHLRDVRPHADTGGLEVGRRAVVGLGVHRLLADEAEHVRLEPLVADQRHGLLEHLDEPALAFGQRQVQDVDGVRGLRLAGDPVHRQRRPVELDVPGVQDELLGLFGGHDARPLSS